MEEVEGHGIKDWKEDLLHLKNQLQRNQVGTCGKSDNKQKKKDNRAVAAKFSSRALTPGSSGMDEIEEDDSNTADAVSDDDITESGDETTYSAENKNCEESERYGPCHCNSRQAWSLSKTEDHVCSLSGQQHWAGLGQDQC